MFVQWVQELKKVYNNNIEAVDFLVGMLAAILAVTISAMVYWHFYRCSMLNISKQAASTMCLLASPVCLLSCTCIVTCPCGLRGNCSTGSDACALCRRVLGGEPAA